MPYGTIKSAPIKKDSKGYYIVQDDVKKYMTGWKPNYVIFKNKRGYYFEEDDSTKTYLKNLNKKTRKVKKSKKATKRRKV